MGCLCLIRVFVIFVFLGQLNLTTARLFWLPPSDGPNAPNVPVSFAKICKKKHFSPWLNTMFIFEVFRSWRERYFTRVHLRYGLWKCWVCFNFLDQIFEFKLIDMNDALYREVDERPLITGLVGYTHPRVSHETQFKAPLLETPLQSRDPKSNLQSVVGLNWPRWAKRPSPENHLKALSQKHV